MYGKWSAESRSLGARVRKSLSTNEHPSRLRRDPLRRALSVRLGEPKASEIPSNFVGRGSSPFGDGSSQRGRTKSTNRQKERSGFNLSSSYLVFFLPAVLAGSPKSFGHWQQAWTLRFSTESLARYTGGRSMFRQRVGGISLAFGCRCRT